MENQQGQGISKQEEDLFVGLSVLHGCTRQLDEVGASAEAIQICFEGGKRLDYRELVDLVQGAIGPLKEDEVSESE